MRSPAVPVSELLYCSNNCSTDNVNTSTLSLSDSKITSKLNIFDEFTKEEVRQDTMGM
jgi:hypothetical protein